MKRPVAFVLKSTVVNYYKALGVTPVATAAQIKASYYALARQHHPDHCGGSGTQMAAITEAYAVLRDPARRSAYDAKRKLLGKVCSTCKGAGVVYKQKGFTRREAVTCRICGGSGTQQRGE